jgi:hypothetical protein
MRLTGLARESLCTVHSFQSTDSLHCTYYHSAVSLPSYEWLRAGAFDLLIDPANLPYRLVGAV